MPSASVDADIRIGRRRHPHRSVQTSASVDADIRIGRYETEKMKICRAEDVLKDAKS
ncbi:hypothetical protein [Leyella stercorea]|uniref:hypothetical protein n=1 Tax=Leyella stercorea TaxID=363265 RepID=UPI00266C1C18|nr:hypothetical protein [Leyella stercorea]